MTRKRPRGIREALYRRIRVSVRTMNVIIAAIVLLLVVALVLGILSGRG